MRCALGFSISERFALGLVFPGDKMRVARFRTQIKFHRDRKHEKKIKILNFSMFTFFRQINEKIYVDKLNSTSLDTVILG